MQFLETQIILIFLYTQLQARPTLKMAPRSSPWSGQLTKLRLNQAPRARLTSEYHQPSQVPLRWPDISGTLNTMGRTRCEQSQVAKNIPGIRLPSAAICPNSPSVPVRSGAYLGFSLMVYNTMGRSSAVRAGIKTCLGEGVLSIMHLRSLDTPTDKSLHILPETGRKVRRFSCLLWRFKCNSGRLKHEATPTAKKTLQKPRRSARVINLC